MAITAQIRQDGANFVVTLNGQIDESVTEGLKPLLSIPNESCTLDLSGIVGINSTGVRGWLTFMQAFRQTRPVILKNCPPDIVVQINMIPAFLGNAKIESFAAHYLCTSCKKGFTKTFETAEGIESLNTSVANQPCPQCKTSCECDDSPDIYLNFLTV